MEGVTAQNVSVSEFFLFGPGRSHVFLWWPTDCRAIIADLPEAERKKRRLCPTASIIVEAGTFIHGLGPGMCFAIRVRFSVACFAPIHMKQIVHMHVKKSCCLAAHVGFIHPAATQCDGHVSENHCMPAHSCNILQ